MTDSNSHPNSHPNFYPKYGLLKLPAFWLVLVVSAIIAISLVYSSFYYYRLSYAAGVLGVLLITLGLAAPCIALIILNHRNKQMDQQLDLQHKQAAFANHYIHVEHFNAHMPAELLKRLGMSSRVLHTLFYPGSKNGDFADNQSLVKFIHCQFAEVVQAAQVVLKLQKSLDDDELAVVNNRLEFAINHSVALMYFIADKARGQSPQCNDFYFIKDTMADYSDLFNAVIYFDGMADNKYDLSAYFELFDVADNKVWFSRNEHFLRRCREDNQQNNPLLAEFEQWR
ncbi:MAG: hypothetical protein HRT35_28275 [Algicola sp.]|nr:hypothetical protein [Algicola sp.]